VGADLGERFGVADRGEDVRWGHGAGEGEESVFVGRRVVAGVSGQRQDPAVCLLQEQCHPDRRPPGLAADKDQLFVPQRPGGQPQITAGVLDVDLYVFLGRPVVAECLQPRRGSPAPAGRVHDEVGGEDLFSAAGGQHPCSGDPVTGQGGDQAGYRTLVPDRDVAQCPDPVADMGFQARPARQIRWLTGFTILAQQVPPESEPELPRSTQHRHTVGG